MTDDKNQNLSPAERYKREMEKRSAILQEQKKGSAPDLVAAQAMLNSLGPEASGKFTLEQLSQAQKERDRAETGSPTLSEASKRWTPQMSEDLARVKAEADRQHEEQQERERRAKERPEEDELSEEEREKVLEELERDFPGLNVGRIRAQLNSKAEREAVEKRLEPIDFTEGFLSGEYKQLVPIVPGKFEVEFRTIYPIELQTIRAIAFKKVVDDPRFELVLDNMISTMLLVAHIVSINGHVEPPHMVGDSMYTAKFDEEIFKAKLDKYLRQPMAMIQSLSSHADWFEERVRALFSAENVKNG